jgi:hypothetical protein
MLYAEYRLVVYVYIYIYDDDEIKENLVAAICVARLSCRTIIGGVLKILSFSGYACMDACFSAVT